MQMPVASINLNPLLPTLDFEDMLAMLARIGTADSWAAKLGSSDSLRRAVANLVRIGSEKWRFDMKMKNYERLAPEASRSTWWIFFQSERSGEKDLYRRLEKYAEDFHTQVLNEKYAQEYARKALLQIARDIKKDGLEDAYQKLQQHLAAKGNEKGKQNVFQPTSKQCAKRRPKGR